MAIHYPSDSVPDLEANDNTLERQVGTMLLDTTTGLLWWSANALVPDYRPVGTAGNIDIAVGYTLTFDSGDLTFTPDGTNVEIDGTGLALWHADAFAIVNPLDTTMRLQFSTGLIPTGTTRTVWFNNINYVVGGQLYAGASSPLTNIAVPTVFDNPYVYPGNTTGFRTTLRITAICRSDSFNAGDTHTYSLQLNDSGGVQTVVTSTPVNGVPGERCVLQGTITFQASAAVAAGPAQFLSHWTSGAAYTMGPAAGPLLNYDTTNDITIQVEVTHSAQSPANISVVEQLIVEIC